MKFISHSQAGQDEWVWNTLGQPTSGRFVDAGCSHPININNTYALERMGWHGLMVDNDQGAVELCMKERKSAAFQCDLTSVNAIAFWWLLPNSVDYLSLDIDEATLDALKLIPLDKIKPRCATIEHDSYRLGNGMRDAIRKIMLGYGYKLAKADVEHQGLAFEDWWIL